MAILTKEQVIDSWGMLVENGQGRSNEVFQMTSDFIRESKAPSLKTKNEKMSPGVVGSILGSKRDFLVVRDQHLSAYQVFINVRDYGENLDVSWYLTYRPSFFKALLHLFRSSAFALSELDLFEQADLKAYATVCHHSTLKAVENLMQKLNQDTAKINRESKGFLGVS